ncbi:MoaF-related domain-containing protein [Nocardia sp. NPDC020380]|uniref:MoaF-related domain-containing protein n=1 Tax=Nocardia sp. NPDC020380 TaxID=3364309 RepID=UPI003790AC7E
MGRIIGALALVAVALAATGCVADPPAPQQVSKSHAAASLGPAAVPSDLEGKTVQLTYDSGSGGTVTFAGDGKSLTFIAADTGRKTTSPVAVVPVEAGIFLVTWTEENGTVISQIQDYKTGKLQATFSRRADTETGFVIESRTGSVRLTD